MNTNFQRNSKESRPIKGKGRIWSHQDGFSKLFLIQEKRTTHESKRGRGSELGLTILAESLLDWIHFLGFLRIELLEEKKNT